MLVTGRAKVDRCHFPAAQDVSPTIAGQAATRPLLQQRTGFCKREPWEPRMECSRITVAQVAQRFRFYVSLRKNS